MNEGLLVSVLFCSLPSLIKKAYLRHALIYYIIKVFRYQTLQLRVLLRNHFVAITAAITRGARGCLESPKHLRSNCIQGVPLQLRADERRKQMILEKKLHDVRKSGRVTKPRRIINQLRLGGALKTDVQKAFYERDFGKKARPLRLFAYSIKIEAKTTCI